MNYGFGYNQAIQSKIQYSSSLSLGIFFNLPYTVTACHEGTCERLWMVEFCPLFKTRGATYYMLLFHATPFNCNMHFLHIYFLFQQFLRGKFYAYSGVHIQAYMPWTCNFVNELHSLTSLVSIILLLGQGSLHKL